jgi:hypothetical protein
MSALAIFFLLISCAVGAENSTGNGNWTKVMLPGTTCLDGSPGAVYVRPPLYPTARVTTFVVYFEGGGWCYGLKDCYGRSLTDLGSSNDYKDYPPNVLPLGVSYEGASMFTSPPFVNATIAYAKYCTGDSWTSQNSTVSTWNNTRLYFNGRQMLEELFKTLMPLGLSTASTVVHAGCSAGALTTYLHIDYLASLLPASTLLLGVADAMFALNVSAYPGNVPNFVSSMYAWGFEAWNSSSSVSAACLTANAGSGAACFFGGALAPFVQTPLFVVNSKHDTWQEITVMGLNHSICPGTVAPDGAITLCRPGFEAEAAYWTAYGETMAAHLEALPPRHGGFLTNCPLHCQTGTGWADPSTGRVADLGQAFVTWFYDAVANSRKTGWKAPRFIANKADACVMGPVVC